MTARPTRRLAAILLVVTAGLFAIGVSQESDDNHSEGSETSTAVGATDTHDDESGETAEEGEAEQGEDAHDEATEGDGQEERDILGVDPEASGLVAIGVIVSLALAAALWFTDRRDLAGIAAMFALVFAVLDIAEVSHQLDEDNNGLATLAVAIAIGHGVAALGAGHLVLRPDTHMEVS